MPVSNLDVQTQSCKSIQVRQHVVWYCQPKVLGWKDGKSSKILSMIQKAPKTKAEEAGRSEVNLRYKDLLELCLLLPSTHSHRSAYRNSLEGQIQSGWVKRPSAHLWYRKGTAYKNKDHVSKRMTERKLQWREDGTCLTNLVKGQTGNATDCASYPRSLATGHHPSR